MSITAIVENGAIKLPPGTELPEGATVEIVLSEPAAENIPTLYEQFEEFIGCIKDGPDDISSEHDHYAHGAPKRGVR